MEIGKVASAARTAASFSRGGGQRWSLQTGKPRQATGKLISAFQLGLIFTKPLLGSTQFVRQPFQAGRLAF